MLRSLSGMLSLFFLLSEPDLMPYWPEPEPIANPAAADRWAGRVLSADSPIVV